MLLPDHEIRKRCVNPVFFHEGKPLLSPFSEGVQGDGVISYGLSSAGYDLRMDREVWVYKNVKGIPVDPKRFRGNIEDVKKYQRDLFEVYEADGAVTIPGHGYMLATSVEEFHMPPDLLGVCFGKSTYCRCGIIVNVSPQEPVWRGQLTIEISNSSPSPAIVYPMEGIAQVIFLMTFGIPEKTYASKGGKYQDQKGVTAARVL